jgi:uncharacterized OB-fold protein
MTAPRFISPPEPHEAFFWSSGADGRLRLHRCEPCGRFHHPPLPFCPYCLSRAVTPAPVAGTGTVATFTVNHQPFVPGFDVPYVIAFVEIDEDPSIRLTTNIVGIEPAGVSIGMRVRVVFERSGDHWVPLFEPCSSTATDD